MNPTTTRPGTVGGINGNCRATHVCVTVQLRVWDGAIWRNVGTLGDAVVLPNGGCGKRAAGRATCRTNTQTSWRSIVDVDVIGVPDAPNPHITRAV